MAAQQPAPVSGERARHLVHPVLGGHAGAGRRLDHRLAVLVHPHHEVHGVIAEAVVARDAVGADLLERVAEMGIAVGVVDRGSEVELRHRSPC